MRAQALSQTFQVLILANYLTSLDINFVIRKMEINIPAKMHNLIVIMIKHQRNQTKATFYKTTGLVASEMSMLQRTKRGCFNSMQPMIADGNITARKHMIGTNRNVNTNILLDSSMVSMSSFLNLITEWWLRRGMSLVLGGST